MRNDLLAAYYGQPVATGTPPVFFARFDSKEDAETGQAISYLSSAYAETFNGVGCISTKAYSSQKAIEFNAGDLFSSDAPCTYSIWMACRDTAARRATPLRLGNSVVVQAYRPNLSVAGSTVYTSLAANSWRNITLLFSGGEINVWVNAVPCGTVQYSLAGASNVVSMGTVDNTSYIFSFALCRIYDRLLSRAEIKAIYRELQ